MKPLERRGAQGHPKTPGKSRAFLLKQWVHEHVSRKDHGVFSPRNLLEMSERTVALFSRVL